MSDHQEAVMSGIAIAGIAICILTVFAVDGIQGVAEYVVAIVIATSILMAAAELVRRFA